MMPAIYMMLFVPMMVLMVWCIQKSGDKFMAYKKKKKKK